MCTIKLFTMYNSLNYEFKEYFPEDDRLEISVGVVHGVKKRTIVVPSCTSDTVANKTGKGDTRMSQPKGSQNISRP